MADALEDIWDGAKEVVEFAGDVTGVNWLLDEIGDLFKVDTPEVGASFGLQIQANAPKRHLYGEDVVGGNIIGYGKLEENGKSYHVMHCVLFNHPCESVIIDTINSKPASIFSSYYEQEIQLGNHTTASTMALAHCYNWTSSHIGYNQTCVTIKVEINEDKFPNGIEDIRWKVKGKKVYDPRKDTTVGGTGTHRADDSTTWEYSNNSILCAYDNARHGGYKEIPAARLSALQIMSEANICDELVTYTENGQTKSEPRYSCNGWFEKTSSAPDILSGILKSCAGRVLRSGGQLFLKAGAYSGPAVVTLTLDDASGAIQYNPFPTIKNRLNSVRASIINPNKGWVKTAIAPIVDSVHQNTTGMTLDAEIDGPFVRSESQIKRLCNQAMAQANAGSMTFPTKDKAFLAFVGKVVQVVIPERGINGEFLIKKGEPKFNPDGDWEMTFFLKEESTVLYPDDYIPVTDEATPNTNLPDLSIPSEVINLAFVENTTSKELKGTITWDYQNLLYSGFELTFKSGLNIVKQFTVTSNRYDIPSNEVFFDSVIIRTTNRFARFSTPVSIPVGFTLPLKPTNLVHNNGIFNWDYSAPTTISAFTLILKSANQTYTYTTPVDLTTTEYSQSIKSLPAGTYNVVLFATGLNTINSEILAGSFDTDGDSNYSNDNLSLSADGYLTLDYNGNSINLGAITTTGIGAETPTGAQEKADAAELAAKNYADSNFINSGIYANEKAALQAQIDKSITTFFLDGVPTLANSPANNWTTNEDKNVHLGDLYYDNLTGYAYRFLINVSTYEWSRVTDNDVTKALADAAKAQDTADGKRRVFVAEPVTPYDVGDLWDTGSALKRCQTAKTNVQSYSANDWVIASDTTDYDDSRVSNNALNLGGRNLFENSAEIELNNTTLEHGYFADIEHVMDKVDIGEDITISFDVKQLDNGNNGQFLQVYSSNKRNIKNFQPKIFYNIGTEWTRLSFTTKITSALPSNFAHTYIEFYSNYGTGDFWHVRKLKIERGNKATDWTVAPEDLKTKADAAEANAIIAADTAAQAKADLAKTQAQAYADGIVTAEEQRAIADAQTKADAAQANAISAAETFTNSKSAQETLYDSLAAAPHTMPAGSPFGYGFSTSIFWNFVTDFIPVKKGETLQFEVWAKQTGSTAKAYMGLSRYDKNKKPIASNNANIYEGLINTVIPTSWTKFKGSHTLPISHTPFEGSDGSAVYYVKLVLLMNYQTTGQAYYSGLRLYRTPDQEYMPNLVSAGVGTTLNINPLSSTDNGSSAKITIASHTRQYGFGLLSLNAGSITGLSFNTKYYVYYDDINYQGGAVTYIATTSLQTLAAGNNRIYVSSITTASDGGGATEPDLDQCVTLDMWLTPTLQAENVKSTDKIDVWFKGETAHKAEVLQAETIENHQVIYEIETVSGAIVRVSESTPLEFENHVIITPKELITGEDCLATLKGEDKTLCWEVVVRCEIIGEQPVKHISVGNGSFAAGQDPENRIITHNAQLKP